MDIKSQSERRNRMESVARLAARVTDYLSAEIVVNRRTGEEYLEAGLKLGNTLYAWRSDFDDNTPFLTALVELKAAVEALRESE